MRGSITASLIGSHLIGKAKDLLLDELTERFPATTPDVVFSLMIRALPDTAFVSAARRSSEDKNFDENIRFLRFLVMMSPKLSDVLI